MVSVIEAQIYKNPQYFTLPADFRRRLLRREGSDDTKRMHKESLSAMLILTAWTYLSVDLPKCFFLKTYENTEMFSAKKGSVEKRWGYPVLYVCTSSRHIRRMLGAPDCSHCVPLVRVSHIMYLFEAPRQDMNVKR